MKVEGINNIYRKEVIDFLLEDEQNLFEYQRILDGDDEKKKYFLRTLISKVNEILTLKEENQILLEKNQHLVNLNEKNVQEIERLKKINQALKEIINLTE